MTQQEQTFDGLGIAPKILEKLDQLHFKIPTPIQYKAIPLAMEGKDMIGVAQTGTGKTLAFGIPMIQRLMNSKGAGLVLVPTRELAIQVEATLFKVGQIFKIRTAVLIGGASMYNQIQAVKKNPHVFIATPGRLIDHLTQKTVRLNHVSILVLDEADRMLDMGFMPQIKRILDQVPKDRQTLIFSATIPEAIVKIASVHMKVPVSIEIAPSGSTPERITHELFIVKKENKKELLNKILERYSGSILLFTRMKVDAAKVSHFIRARGHRAAEIHSNKSLSQRREALEGFKSGKYKILVATDIAARGIDVTGIELVLNYDLPEDPENYVHRIGRTGRAGHKGHAISFATPDQRNDVQSIERLIKTAIPVSEPPDIPVERFAKPQVVFSSNRWRGPRRGGRRRF